MKRLQQEKYTTDNGEILAADIYTLAPYQHLGDGFYTWECGYCRTEHNSRTCGWPIAGQVEKCDKCKNVNLLVSTLTNELNALRASTWADDGRQQELESLRTIQRFNEHDLLDIRRKIIDEVQIAIDKIMKTI
jgi:hypothetical protein